MRDPSFAGQDLQFNNELVPPTVFHRNLILSFFYESTVSSILKQKVARGICFDPTVINATINL